MLAMIKNGKKFDLLFSVSIKDCVVDTYRGSGPGGQHRNKTETAVRVKHLPSGAVGESQEMKSQYSNKQRAFSRMAESEKFQCWAKVEATRRAGEPSVESKVRKMLEQDNIRVDIHDAKGRWIESVELKPTEAEIDALLETMET